MTHYPEGSPTPIEGQVQESFRIEGPITTAERAWGLVGDTDWMNRAAGNGSVLSMTVQPEPDGFALLQGEMAGPLGTRVPFSEVWSSWVSERFFRQVRDLKSPIAVRSDYRAELVPVAGGVRPVVEMKLSGPGWGSMLRRGLSLNGMERRWQAALDRLAQADPDGTGAGRTLEAEALAALGRWRQASNASLVERFEHAFRHDRPGEIARLRAFVLADRWGEDRDAVLETLLVGVDAGAVELYWSVRCVRCYGQVAGGRLLSDLADHAACPACGVQSNTDLGENVEAVFAPHPSVVSQLEVNFCTIFPAAAPSQRAVLTLAPGQRIQTEAFVPPGDWRLGVGGGAPDVDVLAGDAGASSIRWAGESGGNLHVKAGEVALDVENRTPTRARVYLTRLGGALPIVPASRLTMNATFRARFGHQVLAPDLRVGVRSITVLFTDLGGSTAMYEELGDARAFAVVRDHFAILRSVSARRGGTVVKTSGDAVMAAFFDGSSAMTAALEMQEEFGRWARGLSMDNPPTLKVGLHRGTALAVHTDQAGLDYFGGTVNLAARAQGAAGDGDVVWTEVLQGDPLVAGVLAKRGFVSRTFSKELKGLGVVQLYRAVPQNDEPAAK
jgi:class 3 adenylate cyclase